jgi:hypothetical protein
MTDSFFRRTLGSVYSLVSNATSDPVSKAWYFQDKDLLTKLWEMDSAKAYLDEQGEPQLEYQLREGYCGSATQRCVLKSLGYKNIRAQKGGESKPQIWCEHVIEVARESMHGGESKDELETTIVEGVSYEEFLKTIRDGLANKDCRIACNFLRPALMGFMGWRIFPMNFLLGLMGGHFSPILGVLDDVPNVDSPLVAIWDTNHKYNGAYFVPAKRLYEAVHAVDLSAHKHRALILVTKK